MNLKRTILPVAALLLAAQASLAVPADPRPKLMRQADGTTVTVLMSGDEHAHMLRTADGFPLYYNAASGNFEYAALAADGSIRGSGMAAADAGRRDAKAAAYLAALDVKTVEKAAMAGKKTAADGGKTAARNRAGGPQRIKLTGFPTVGKAKTLVILVEFADLGFTTVGDPHDFYSRMLNEEGFTHSNGATGSARDFYLASSGGMFDPDFVVVGPVKLSHDADYYGGDFPSRDANAQEMITEACRAIDAETDFSQFDTDGDGYVDNVYCFYAGPGQADDPGATNAVWPHSAELEAFGKSLTLDGVKISHYACSNERRFSATEKIPAGIGTFVHEFGHVLGLADHYDSEDSRTFTVGEWDTMSTGSYNNDGNTPPVFSAFERAELGWLDYTELTVTADSVCSLDDLKECGRAFRVGVPGNDNEYFIFENRRQTGWDTYLPGHGMLVWHIDMDREAWENNTVNTIPAHQRVDIIAADGIRNAATRKADPFPGTDNIRQYDLKTWGGATLLSFDEITERDATVRFTLAGSAVAIPQPAAVTTSAVADSSFTMTWSGVGCADYYLVTVAETAAGGSLSPIEGLDGARFSNVAVVDVKGLRPATEYSVSVVAGFGSHLSEPQTITVTTLKLAFAKVIPAGLKATEVSEYGFSASWEAVSEADGYIADLYRHQRAETPESRGYGFGDRAEGMPPLWSAGDLSFYSVSGYYGEAAPSLRMSADGDCLEIEYPGCLINGLSFWCRLRNGNGSLCIDRLTDGGWTEAATVVPDADGGIKTVELEPCARIRIRYSRESGFAVVDDVTASCLGTERIPVEGFTGYSLGNVQSFTFPGLTAETTYGLRITATSGGERSLPSDELVVTTGAKGSAIQAVGSDSTAPQACYDLSGRKVPEGNSRKGVYIVPGKGKVIK
ncbi:MAG: M6 family metalloprotease domain-containing protein [Prevotella sp.]|nr:M6 family metalloprotease domain-containing protein [Prevotella sp.]